MHARTWHTRQTLDTSPTDGVGTATATAAAAAVS